MWSPQKMLYQEFTVPSRPKESVSLHDYFNMYRGVKFCITILSTICINCRLNVKTYKV